MHRWTSGLSRRARWAGLLLGLAGLALLAVTPLSGAPAPAALAQPPGTPTGYDPLSPEEQAAALSGVSAALGVQAAAAPERLSTPDEPGEARVSAPAESVVLVERRQETKEVMAAAWPRRADVYVYRYADNTMLHSVYNLDTGQVDASEVLRGVQLNLTEQERQLAVEIAWADPDLRASIADAYQSHGGVTLRGPEEIDARVFTYVGGTAPDLEGPGGAACAVDRCAQLLILTPDGATLETLPLVNLTQLQVTAIMAPPALGHH